MKEAEMYQAKIEQIAEICHEANRAFQRINGEIVNFPWENLSQEMRDSAIQGVEGVLQGNTPRESHEQWLKFKEEFGWTYGEVKSFDKKTHPCFLDYDDLPEDQKIKDRLFVGITQALVN